MSVERVVVVCNGNRENYHRPTDLVAFTRARSRAFGPGARLSLRTEPAWVPQPRSELQILDNDHDVELDVTNVSVEGVVNSTWHVAASAPDVEPVNVMDPAHAERMRFREVWSCPVQGCTQRLRVLRHRRDAALDALAAARVPSVTLEVFRAALERA